MKLYGDQRSGNCYKITLTAALLRLEFDFMPIDILAGEARTDAFKRLNPVGKIPLLTLDDGRCLSESNAIINYLAHNSHLLPTDAFQLALVQQWQFFEQYSHEPYIAVARFINKFQGLPKEQLAQYESKQAGGHQALQVMEQQLNTTPYLAGNQLSVADISLFAYTHVADEGGFDLSAYPQILSWLERVQTEPGFLPMIGG